MDENEIMVGDHVSVWDGNPQSLQRCIEVKGILDGEVYYDIEDDEGKPLRVHESVKHCHPLKLHQEDVKQYGNFFDYTWQFHNERFTEPTLQNWPLCFNIDGKKFRVLNMSQGIVFNVKETIERFDRVWGVLPSVDKRYDYNIFVAETKKGG